jgi:hypothetical protein
MKEQTRQAFGPETDVLRVIAAGEPLFNRKLAG